MPPASRRSVTDEVEPLEQPVERIAPERVGNVAPEHALERVRLEQAAVEKRNRAEPRRRPGSAPPPAG